MIDIKETPLSTEQRNALDDKEFGIPELRAYPLNDVSHVEQAVRMFNHVDPEYERELADNLNKAIKKFGLKINVGDTNRFKKYVKESIIMNDRMNNVSSILEGLNEGKSEMTKEKFLDYVRIQMSGVTNMFDVNCVCSLSKEGLTKEDCMDIMKNYAKYRKQWVK